MDPAFEAIIKEAGFESIEEFNEMVSSVNMHEKFLEFKNWQENDGSKAGLEKLLDE